MINDFKACGGFLMLATGFRMVKLKNFPTADMIPAMVLIMPMSWFWVNYILPLDHKLSWQIFISEFRNGDLLLFRSITIKIIDDCNGAYKKTNQIVNRKFLPDIVL